MAHGFYLEAEYESGFVITEDEVDQSPYDATRNIFHAILNGRPTDAGEGRMVRWSMIPTAGGQRYDVDWTELWEVDSPRPVYYREMQSVKAPDTDEVVSCLAHHFGFQYNDEDGKNTQNIIDISSSEDGQWLSY